MNWSQKTLQALTKPRPFQAERFFLVLALSMALGAIASARYHFFMQNYSGFVIQEVLPASGKMQWAEKALHRSVPKAQIPNAHLDSWPWASPLFRNKHFQYGDSLSPIGSDYLGLWHYTKMILTGQNPYMIDFFFTYNFKIPNTPMIQDPMVPAQVVGPLSYPPFAALILVPFFSNNYFLSLVKYYSIFGLFLLICMWGTIKNTVDTKWPLTLLLATTVFTSYPLAILLDRGNIEGILFIFIALGLFAYHQKFYFISAALIAVAASCKFYPGIFFILFFLDRRWKELAFGSFFSLALTAISLLVINHPIHDTFARFATHLSGVNEFMLFDGGSIQFSHTLCTLISGIIYFDFSNPTVQAGLRSFCRIYPYVIGVLMLGIIWRIQRFDLCGRVGVLTVTMVFFPFFSYDYTLIHLYIPFAWWLVKLAGRRQASILELVPACLLGLISLPKQYLVGLFALGPGISFAVNGFALGILLIMLLFNATDQAAETAMG